MGPLLQESGMAAASIASALLTSAPSSIGCFPVLVSKLENSQNPPSHADLSLFSFTWVRMVGTKPPLRCIFWRSLPYIHHNAMYITVLSIMCYLAKQTCLNVVLDAWQFQITGLSGKKVSFFSPNKTEQWEVGTIFTISLYLPIIICAMLAYTDLVEERKWRMQQVANWELGVWSSEF